MNQKKKRGHEIRDVLAGSIAMELGIEPGDRLFSINEQEIEDIFDYQFYVEDTYIEILLEKKSGEQWILEIDKDENEELGIVFEKGLMDEYRSCRNKCIFCFIDQMPKGMRETLYFKDDDSRLSFLQGNYVTLTNMSEHDVDRIIRYHLSPINISFHTMNPQLRCQMLNNRFAGEALKKVDRLYEAGISMNGQIVLCKGVNDREELIFSIRELMRYLPCLESVSVVPVGLTKYREGLYPLEPFGKEDARQVLSIIRCFQKEAFEKYGTHFVHAGDEWYILAEEELPEGDNYDGYLQLENGVGMLRLLKDEFREAMKELREKIREKRITVKKRDVSIATGKLAFGFIREMAEEIEKELPQISIRIYEIRNDFFGERITVSGLLTGQDLIAQLKGKQLGEALLLPMNMLRAGEEIFLDDITVFELERALQVKADIVKSSGYDFVDAVLGKD